MRSGFTLVELVVVILLLGILAGVAAPKLLGVTSSANDNCARESLTAIRDAIDTFTEMTGRRPGADGDEATFKSEIATYLRKFPTLPVGPTPAQNSTVLMSGDPGPPSGSATPAAGWKYYFNTGDFIINLHRRVETDDSVFYDEL